MYIRPTSNTHSATYLHKITPKIARRRLRIPTSSLEGVRMVPTRQPRRPPERDGCVRPTAGRAPKIEWMGIIAVLIDASSAHNGSVVSSTPSPIASWCTI